MYCLIVGYMVTSQKVVGSIPMGVTGFFILLILPVALWHWDWLSL